MSRYRQTDSREERNPWLVLLSVALGLFMVVVDVSILNIALPSLTADLNASMAEIEWALMAYTLALTAMVPLFGRISDVIGRKRLFLSGLLVFALSSLLAAQSSTIGLLIAARLVQALGGALITANTLAIITDTFPAGQRGVAMGIQSILISGGAAMGPTLGGFLVTHYGWEAVFYVNVPVGIVAAALAALVLPPLQSNRSLEPIDWVGAGTLMAGMTSFLLGITKAPSWGWGSPPMLLLTIGGLALLVVFVAWERQARFPLVDLSLFRIWQYSAGLLAGIFATLAMASLMFLFPYFWQGLRGYSPQEAGLLMLPFPLTFMVVSPISGRLSDSIGARVLSTTGLTVVMAGLYAISRITADMAVWDVLWRMVLFGAGMGMFMAPNNNAVMSAAPATKRGVASGLLGMSRYVGQSVGVAFGGTLFAHGMGKMAEIGAEGLPSPELWQQLAGNPAALEALSNRFVEAMGTVALYAIPLAAAGALMSWLRGRQSPPSVPQEAPGD